MTCVEARARLLEAEPADLQSDGTGPLAGHLRTCDDCRTAASLISAGMRELDAALRPPPAPLPLPTVLSARRPWHGRWRRALPTLAAAASLVLALVLMERGWPNPASAPPPPADAGSAVADLDSGFAPDVLSSPVVSVPEGSNVVVFRTADPRITVVWHY